MSEKGDQISFFEIEESELRQARWKRIYEHWLAMPNELHIADGSIERKGLHNNFKFSTDLWLITSSIRHKCAYMPCNMYCWLNTCEPPEYWVFTKQNEATGRRVDACPYCGARLKDGRGDVTVYKDQRRHHCFPLTP